MVQCQPDCTIWVTFSCYHCHHCRESIYNLIKHDKARRRLLISEYVIDSSPHCDTHDDGDCKLSCSCANAVLAFVFALPTTELCVCLLHSCSRRL